MLLAREGATQAPEAVGRRADPAVAACWHPRPEELMEVNEGVWSHSTSSWLSSISGSSRLNRRV